MSFASLFPSEFKGNIIDSFSPEALADFDYNDELQLKNKAVKGLLDKSEYLKVLAPVVPSVLPRNYRTTSKRRVTFQNGKLYFHFGKKPQKQIVASSNLEAAGHQEIYQALHGFFSQKRFLSAGANLNYLILRGSYTEFALILNVRSLNASFIRSYRSCTEEIKKLFPSISSVFTYLDETGSDYYLEAERPVNQVAFKKLAGPANLALKLADKKFLYPAESFSQVNESILPCVLKVLNDEIPENVHLLDLYCGYGLWTLALGDKLLSAWGAELSNQSIQAAKSNAAYHYKDKPFHFEKNFISADLLKSKLPFPKGQKEYIILDPPRKGCAADVLETLIARRSAKIFHLFCGANEIVPALKIYQANGCKIEKLIPFDFFPGSLNIEMLAIITPPHKK